MTSILLRAALGGRTIRCCSASSHFINVNINFAAACTGLPKECEALTSVSTFLPTLLHRKFCVKILEKNDMKYVDANPERGIQKIYTGMMANTIRILKLFSLTTTVIGIGVQPLVYMQAMSAGETNKFTLPLFGAIAVFAVASPMFIHYITKKYVIQVDYNSKKDTYIATTYNLFTTKKRVEFTPNDVTIPDLLGMFTSCAIKGKPVFLDSKSFTKREHYKRIMGYDKPIFETAQTEIQDDEKHFKRNN